MSLTDTPKKYHLDITPDDVGKYVIIAGDPARIPLIAEHFENPRFVSSNREYTTYTGILNGTAVSAVSVGIGGPSAAIAVEELCQCGVHTVIRVGTTGGMKDCVRGGDIVIASSAIRAEGTSREYLPYGYPAAADFTVTKALYEASRALSSDKDGERVHVGVVQSKDSFYGQTSPETMPVSDMLKDRWDAYIKCGCLASEMECAALFSVGTVRNIRTGAVLSVLWNTERSRKGLPDTICKFSDKAIKCAIEGIRILIKNDEIQNSD